jgi:hypothetical protein
MKILITVAVVASLTGRVVFAQGTIAFQNFSQPTFFAPDYLSDGTTKLSRPQLMAELFSHRCLSTQFQNLRYVPWEDWLWHC